MSDQPRFLALWRLLFGVAVAATLAVSLAPSVPASSISFGDKLGHVGVYAVNGALAALAFPGAKSLRWALLGLLAMGAGLELVQIALPTRSGSWLDAGANALGLCAVGGVLLWRRRAASP